MSYFYNINKETLIRMYKIMKFDKDPKKVFVLSDFRFGSKNKGNTKTHGKYLQTLKAMGLVEEVDCYISNGRGGKRRGKGWRLKLLENVGRRTRRRRRAPKNSNQKIVISERYEPFKRKLTKKEIDLLHNNGKPLISQEKKS